MHFLTSEQIEHLAIHFLFKIWLINENYYKNDDVLSTHSQSTNFSFHVASKISVKDLKFPVLETKKKKKEWWVKLKVQKYLISDYNHIRKPNHTQCSCAGFSKNTFQRPKFFHKAIQPIVKEWTTVSESSKSSQHMNLNKLFIFP